MKLHTHLLLIALLYTVRSFSQTKNDCEYHYFKNKKVSTSVCYDENNRFGKARAFDKDGKLIYEKEIRKVAGHSHVWFSYYESGAVKKAEWSSAPDAGIQWYKSTTTFSEDGTILDVQEQSHDDLRSPTIRTLPPTTIPRQPVKKEVVKCAVIYQSEFWFINKTKYPIIVHADRKSSDESYTVRIKPGTSAKAGAMIQAEHFENPEPYYHFSVVPADERASKGMLIRASHEEQDGKEKRRYYFEVKEITKRR